MATTNDITTNKNFTRSYTPHGIYKRECVVDWAAALAFTGGALIAADTFQLFTMPAKTIVWGGGVEIIDVCNAGATVCLFDVGVAAADEIANNADGEVAGHFIAGTAASGFEEAFVVATADTLDLTLKTVTGTLTTGKVRVWILASDGNGLA